MTKRTPEQRFRNHFDRLHDLHLEALAAQAKEPPANLVDRILDVSLPEYIPEPGKRLAGQIVHGTTGADAIDAKFHGYQEVCRAHAKWVYSEKSVGMEVYTFRDSSCVCMVEPNLIFASSSCSPQDVEAMMQRLELHGVGFKALH